MRLSTKSRYAITTILELAVNGPQGPVTLSDISEKQGISVSYLEQLFSAMRARGLVRGVRGPGGGYYLGSEAKQISIADVICAVDDYVEYTRSNRSTKDLTGQRSTTNDLWDDLSEQIFSFLSSITLHDLVQQREVNQTAQNARAMKDVLVDLTDKAA